MAATGGCRGCPGKEVAMLAGVSVDYYIRMERGHARGVSDSVLENLARALRLDEAERAHLYDLVRAANAGPRAPPAAPPNSRSVRPCSGCSTR
jgi:transcriptional regulator with XRE-family HTH domain